MNKKDKQRFEEQALPYMGDLYGQAWTLTKNRADAEDLVQETYVRGMKKFKQFKAGTNLRAWLGRIMFSQFVNEYRRRKRRNKEVHVEDAEKFVGEEAADTTLEAISDTDPRDLVGNDTFLESLDENLKEGLEEMDSRYRDVFLMNTVGDLSYKDIAKKLAVPIGTVMSRLHRAKRFMREKLASRPIAT